MSEEQLQWIKNTIIRRIELCTEMMETDRPETRRYGWQRERDAYLHVLDLLGETEYFNGKVFLTSL